MEVDVTEFRVAIRILLIERRPPSRFDQKVMAHERHFMFFTPSTWILVGTPNWFLNFALDVIESLNFGLSFVLDPSDTTPPLLWPLPSPHLTLPNNQRLPQKPSKAPSIMYSGGIQLSQCTAWANTTRTMVPWMQGSRHLTRNKCMSWFTQIPNAPTRTCSGGFQVDFS